MGRVYTRTQEGWEAQRDLRYGLCPSPGLPGSSTSALPLSPHPQSPWHFTRPIYGIGLGLVRFSGDAGGFRLVLSQVGQTGGNGQFLVCACPLGGEEGLRICWAGRQGWSYAPSSASWFQISSLLFFYGFDRGVFPSWVSQ